MNAYFDLPKRNPFSLLSYVGKYKSQFVIQAIGGLVYNTVVVAGPILLGRILDSAAALESKGPSPEGIKALATNCILFVIVTVIFQFARYLKRWYIRDLCNRMVCDMRAGLLSSLLGRRMDKLESESIGDLMSRTVGDVEQIVSTVRSTITEIWDTWLLMFSYFTALLFLNWRITLICTIPIPLAVLLAETVRHPLYNFSVKARKSASKVNSHLHRTLNGINILRLFGREDVENERLKSYCTEQMKWNIKSSMLQNGMVPVYIALASVGIIGVVGLGGTRAVKGLWSIGQFTAYLSMFTAMANRTTSAAKVFNQLHGAKAAWDRIKEKLRDSGLEESNPEDRVTGTGIEGSKKNFFEVDGLFFKYPNSEEYVLEDISFAAKKGAFICITGPVGAGKSALASVLTGLYPYKGSIYIAGRELSEFSPGERADLIAYSGQDSFLFSTTIADNITFGMAENSWSEGDRLKKALYISALEEDMDVFPEGLQTIVGEKGVRVSGGQRQRIALARAIYSEKPILLLDDPFSAVDIGTERRIIERLRSELRDRTILVFSHRLAAFNGADRILVIDHGRLVEQGTHQELLNRKGMFEKIYSAQSWMEEEESA